MVRDCLEETCSCVKVPPVFPPLSPSEPWDEVHCYVSVTCLSSSKASLFCGSSTQPSDVEGLRYEMQLRAARTEMQSYGTGITRGESPAAIPLCQKVSHWWRARISGTHNTGARNPQIKHQIKLIENGAKETSKTWRDFKVSTSFYGKVKSLSL